MTIRASLFVAPILAASFLIASFDRAEAQGEGAKRYSHPTTNGVFDFHDANNDGALSAEEFSNAYNFNSAEDCSTSEGMDMDPRCMSGGPMSHHSHGDVHIHIHKTHPDHHIH